MENILNVSLNVIVIANTIEMSAFWKLYCCIHVFVKKTTSPQNHELNHIYIARILRQLRLILIQKNII